jgi:hypothetical protein
LPRLLVPLAEDRRRKSSLFFFLRKIHSIASDYVLKAWHVHFQEHHPQRRVSSPHLRELPRMRKMMRKLYNGNFDRVPRKHLLIAAMLGLGLIVVLSNLEQAADIDPSELTNALDALDQGYHFATVNGPNSSKNGTSAPCSNTIIPALP